MCMECNGLGRKLEFNTEGFLDMEKSLNEGAIQVPFFAKWDKDGYSASGFFKNDKKLKDFTKEEMDLLLY